MNRFAKFTWAVLAWTILVILWGAFVRASGSGAGCGSHWPTCNGQVIPRPEQIETIIEFVHRLMSGGALILIAIMVVWGWRTTQRGNILRSGLKASAFFIVLEALLGAGLVLFELVATNQSVARAIAMALHLLNTFLLLASLSLTAWWASGRERVNLKDQGWLPVLLGIGLAGVAVIGMSGAITALGDTLFPVSSLAEGLAQDADPNAHFLIRLRVWHPVIAVLVGMYTLYLLWSLRQGALDQTTRKLGMALAALIIIQWAAGLVNVLLLAPIPMQIIHLFIADCVWIAYVLFSASALKQKQA